MDDAVKSLGRTYDNLGRPVKITSYPNDDGTGTPVNEVQYAYSSQNLVQRIYQAHGGAVNISTSPFVEFTYDTDHVSNVYSDGLRVDTMEYPVAAGAHVKSFYGNADTIGDRLNRLAWQKLWGGSALNGNEDHTSKYEYNGTSRLVRIYSESTDTNLERKMYSSSGNYDSLDRFGRPVKFAWKNRAGGGTVIDQTDCTYDYAGSRLTRDIPSSLYATDNRDQAYTYDGLHRLKTFDEGTLAGSSISGTPTRAQDWTLDQLGNWPNFVVKAAGSTTLDQDRTHNEANEITQFSATTGADWVDPLHDAAGNMTYMPVPNDPLEGFKLHYDAWNRLVYVENETDKAVAWYRYNGLRQRIQREVATGPSTTDTYDYYYNDQWQLLTEVKNSAVEAVYHWHPFYIDALAVRMRSGDTHFFLQDANFNVTAAVDDDGNAVVERYAYSPYGEVTYLNADFSVKMAQASAIGNTHLYTGRERDPETGVQLNRHRYYASHIGRWISRDPIKNDVASQEPASAREATQSLGFVDKVNTYAYAESQPTVLVDFNGQWSWWPWWPWKPPPPPPPGGIWLNKCKKCCDELQCTTAANAATCVSLCSSMNTAPQQCEALMNECIGLPLHRRVICEELLKCVCPDIEY